MTVTTFWADDSRQRRNQQTALCCCVGWVVPTKGQALTKGLCVISFVAGGVREDYCRVRRT